MYLTADRMPVILGDDVSIDVWLNNAMSKSETVLRPYEDADLVSHYAGAINLVFFLSDLLICPQAHSTFAATKCYVLNEYFFGKFLFDYSFTYSFF